MGNRDYANQLAEQYMESVSRLVTSADNAYRWFRDQGIEATRSFVRDTWRETQTRLRNAPLINQLPTRYTVPRRLILDSPTHWEGKYFVSVDIWGLAEDTGEKYRRRPLLRFDHQPTLDEIYDAAAEIQPGYGFKRDPARTTMQIAGVFHKKGAQW